VKQALFSLLMLGASCAKETRLQTAPHRCDGLCGQIVDAATHEPVTEFSIAVWDPDPPFPRSQIKLPSGFPKTPGLLVERKDMTTSDGTFILGRPQRSVIVTVVARGYKAFLSKAVDGALPLNVALIRVGSVRGVVADERGLPIPDAHIDDVTSDAKGNFTIDGPAAEWRQIHVQAANHIPLTQIVRDGDERINVTMRAAVELSGIVLDLSGRPVPGAGLTVLCTDFGPLSTLSERDGTFSFHVPRTECAVTAGPGLRNDDEHHEVVSSEPAIIELVDTTTSRRNLEIKLPVCSP